MKKNFILLILTLTLFSCSPANRKLNSFKQSRSLKLSKTVIIKDNMFFSDMQSSVKGGLNSLLGDFLANSMDNKKEKFIKVMIENNINIENIVLKSANKELKKAGINNSDNSEFEIKFIVRLYGFGQRQGLSKKLKPIMVIEAKISDNNNEIVFKDIENITTFNSKTKHYEIDEYIKDYNKINAALEGVASIAISNILKNLNS
ncbi:MAG: hypothetical protein Q7K47_04945 [Fusobacterium sp. JB019]|nr:hypothetical protein [Fusobacterium sp. JB019]MDP0506563.1 hypothetical protein [Fusobacterium sp. JB019]